MFQVTQVIQIDTYIDCAKITRQNLYIDTRSNDTSKNNAYYWSDIGSSLMQIPASYIYL